jgi:hypothetical protein
MKKLISLALIAGLVVGAMAMDASAAKKKKKPKKLTKVVTLDYTGGDLGITTPAASASNCFLKEGAAGDSPVFVCKAFTAMPAKFKYLKIEVIDASGQNAGGFIAHDGIDEDGDGFGDAYGNFCGAHPQPIALTHPGLGVGLSLTPGSCEDGSPSIITQGTVKATFSTHPS